DAGAAEAGQVGDGLAGGGDVVDDDMVDGAGGALAEQDHGDAVGPGGNLVTAEGQRGEDEPVDQLGPDALADQALAGDEALGLVDEDDEALAVGGPDDALGELGEVGDAQLGDGQGDDPGPAAAHAAGRQVGPVAELGHGLLDPGP